MRDVGLRLYSHNVILLFLQLIIQKNTKSIHQTMTRERRGASYSGVSKATVCRKYVV